MIKKTVLFLLLFILLACTVVCYRVFLPRRIQTPAIVYLEIRNGMTAKNIATLLQKENLIRNEQEFRIWAFYFKLDRKIKAGRYQMNQDCSLYRILDILNKGEVTFSSILIPEGLTIEETASRFSQYGGVDSAEFVALCYDPKFIGAFGLSLSSLEGYLFPNTYEFTWGTEARVVIKTLVDRLNKTYEQLSAGSQKMNGYSFQQILTLASIVEKETSLDEERPHVASVFWNRLRIRMPLGADPTVRYATRKFTGSIRQSDLQFDSPYNTRRYAGLPPGPICSPGAKAIKACLFPLQSSDLYFVAKQDGTQEHYFSKTFNEHNQAKKRAKEERKKAISPDNS